MKTIETLIAEIKENEALQKGLAEAMQSSTLDAFLAAQGCGASVEEFAAAVKARPEQLDVEDLSAVAGGKNFTEGLISCISVGFGCAVAAVVSVFGSGTGDGGKGGCLLCHNKGWEEHMPTLDEQIDDLVAFFQEEY